MNESSRLYHRTFHRIVYNRRFSSYFAILVFFSIECILLQPIVSGINHNEFLAQLKVPQCRKDCLDKVSFCRKSYFSIVSRTNCMEIQETQQKSITNRHHFN